MSPRPPAKGPVSARKKPRLNEAEKLTLEREALSYPGLAARLAAATLLAEVLSQMQLLEERVANHPKILALDDRDKALARSIVLATLRRLGFLRAIFARLLQRGMPKNAGLLEAILLTGAAQLLFLDVSDHASVDLAVRGVRLDVRSATFAGLVNATLRQIIRDREELKTQSPPIDIDTPAWLAARWRKTYGRAKADAIMAMHHLEPTLDLTVKDQPQLWAERLKAMLLPTGSIRLIERTAITELPGYADGQWWVQDVSAALPARLVRAKPGMRVAEFCAAPGGKTAQLAQTGAAVTAIDRSAERLKRLQSNMERLQLHAETIVADATTFKAGPFDAILVDAPCSATGTIRRHPDVAWTRRLSDITTLAQIQVRLLDQATGMLRAGGILVYCVCSLEPEEGEAQIAALLRRNPDFERMPILAQEIGQLDECVNALGELRTLPCMLPHENPRMVGMDGFFAARLRRKSEDKS